MDAAVAPGASRSLRPRLPDLLPTLLRPSRQGLGFCGARGICNVLPGLVAKACGAGAVAPVGGTDICDNVVRLRLPPPQRVSYSMMEASTICKRPPTPTRTRPTQEAYARQRLTLSALDGYVARPPRPLTWPRELAALRATCKQLRTSVRAACTFHLRTRACGAGHGGGLAGRPELLLHRAMRQEAAMSDSIVASENYSVGIDVHGRLVAWGRPGWMERSYNHRHRCGPIYGTIRFAPGKLVGSKPPRLVAAAGSRHALFALTTDGNVYYGKINGSRSIRDGRDILQLHLLEDLRGVRICKLTTRFGQAFAVAEDGSVYAWGMQSGGDAAMCCSMGFGEIATALQPQSIPCFGPWSGGRTPISSVAAGVSHTLFVSTRGDVFAVGQFDSGKLGLGFPSKDTDASRGQQLTPKKLRFPQGEQLKVIAAAAGDRHSLFLASGGEVFGCGAGSDGALAAGDEAQWDDCLCTWSPMRLHRVKGACAGIAAGVSSSFFLTENGEVFFAGRARQSVRPFGRPTWWSPKDPFRIPELRDIMQVSVSMELSFFKWEHALFMRTDGQLFGWGHCAHGQVWPFRIGSERHMSRNFYDRVVPVLAPQDALDGVKHSG